MPRVLFSFIIIALTGCYLSGNIINDNLASDYRDEEKNIHAELSVFHFSADSSRLFVRFNTSELLYIKQQEDTFRGNFQVFLQVIDSYENPTVHDTARKTFHINKTLQGTGVNIYTIDFHLPKPGQYVIECNIIDLNKNITQTDYINLDNSSPQSRQNFFLHLSNSANPLFADYLSSNDTFSIDYRSAHSQKLFVNYYRRSFAMAAPPYSYDVRDAFDYKPDSSFIIMSGTGNIFEKEGMYHLRLDTTDKEGETIYRFGKGFPAVATPEALLNPLYYIVTKKEFTELNNSPNKKKAIDKLWLDMGGSTERSRDLIKKYYSRVEKANRLFTSYMEGWHTDRGMIYIVFGVPHDVYKSSTGESWTYGESNSALSITFNFTKATNPFSDNDFVLSRDPVYETMWYRAVDTWREGRAFNDY